MTFISRLFVISLASVIQCTVSLFYIMHTLHKVNVVFFWIQLIYDYKDQGASFGFISLLPQKLPEAKKTSFEAIGIKIPSMV